MTTVLALPLLVEAVVARFAAETVGTPVPCVFGWRQRSRAPGVAQRVVFEPGDDGAAGQLSGARSPGGNPRSLGTLRELFTVYVESQDPTSAENELVQYTSARLLFDGVHRAMYLAAYGTITLESLAWVTDHNERRYGAALRAVYSIDAVIPDLPMTAAPVDSGAAVALSELDETESTTIAAPVRVATTAAITLIGEQTIDGIDVLEGERVLVKDQGTPSTNGVYVASLTSWARALDRDTSAEVPAGLLIFVESGAVNGGSEFVLTTPAPIVLGTTALTFAPMTD